MTEESWPYEQIETHADDAAARLASQYADAEKLQGLVSLWGERVQGIEDAAWSLLTDRWLDVAEGQQLDELGDLVGEPRLGRTDETYRAAIQIRIGLNRGSGEPESVISVMNSLLQSGQYSEDYPAGILITTENEAVSLQQQRGIVSVTPAGVRVRGVSILSEGGVSIGSVTMGGLTTTVRPFFTDLLSQNMQAGRAVAAGGSSISQVLPELPPDTLEQSVGVNRFVAFGSTNTTQINSE